MLRWAIAFFLAGALAGTLAFTHFVPELASLAQLGFFVCVVMFVVCLLLGVTTNKSWDYGSD